MKNITTEITIDASPEQVWDVLTDFENHADWNPFFASIEGTPAVGEQLTVTARSGDGDGMRFRPIVQQADGRILRWKGKFLFGGLFDGTHSYELIEIDGRTRLVHSETFRGLLIPLMGKVLRETQQGFEKFNLALAERVVATRGCEA